VKYSAKIAIHGPRRNRKVLFNKHSCNPDFPEFGRRQSRNIFGINESDRDPEISESQDCNHYSLELGMQE